MRNNLIEKAKKVLLGNKKKGFTLPTNNKLYPAQWKWDSGFIALGYSHFNLKYALDEISTPVSYTHLTLPTKRIV